MVCCLKRPASMAPDLASEEEDRSRLGTVVRTTFTRHKEACSDDNVKLKSVGFCASNMIPEGSYKANNRFVFLFRSVLQITLYAAVIYGSSFRTEM